MKELSNDYSWTQNRHSTDTPPGVVELIKFKSKRFNLTLK